MVVILILLAMAGRSPHRSRLRRLPKTGIGEKVGGADVVFGEEGDYKLLGTFTLEALGLVLDPLKRELRPLPMIIAAI